MDIRHSSLTVGHQSQGSVVEVVRRRLEWLNIGHSTYGRGVT